MLHSPMRDHHLMEETWRAMQEMYQTKIIRSLGVSNFGSSDLNTLLNFRSLKVKPMVVQNKLDVYHVGKQIDPNGDAIIALMQVQNSSSILLGLGLSAFPLSCSRSFNFHSIFTFTGTWHEDDCVQSFLDISLRTSSA